MKKDIKNELEELNSSLVNYKKKDLFEVSDDYFAKMQESVLAKTIHQSNENKVIRLFNYKKILSVAAIFILLVSAVFLVNINLSTAKSSNGLTSEVMYDYLLDNIDDLDNEMFAVVLDDDDLDLEDGIDESLDDLNEYLNNNIEEFTEEELQNYL